MQKGFTIIELLVVLAIASITLTVAIPSLAAFVASNRQAGAVNEFLSSLYLARDEAVTRNVAVTICPSSNGDDCQNVGWEQGRIVFIDEDGDFALDAGEDVLQRGDPLPNDMSVSSPQFDQVLIYRPNGRVMSTNVATNSGQFRFCSAASAENARVANIDFSGRPQAKRLVGDSATAVCGGGG